MKKKRYELILPEWPYANPHLNYLFLVIVDLDEHKYSTLKLKNEEHDVDYYELDDLCSYLHSNR